jgi:hypothetical protein
MFDYRLFFPTSTLDGTERDHRRPLLGHEEKLVYRLPTERREQRIRGRR